MISLENPENLKKITLGFGDYGITSRYGHLKENCLLIFIKLSKVATVTTYIHMHTFQAHACRRVRHILSLVVSY